MNHCFWSCATCLAKSGFIYCSIHLLEVLGISSDQLGEARGGCRSKCLMLSEEAISKSGGRFVLTFRRQS